MFVIWRYIWQVKLVYASPDPSPVVFLLTVPVGGRVGGGALLHFLYVCASGGFKCGVCFSFLFHLVPRECCAS